MVGKGSLSGLLPTQDTRQPKGVYGHDAYCLETMAVDRYMKKVGSVVVVRQYYILFTTSGELRVGGVMIRVYDGFATGLASSWGYRLYKKVNAPYDYP